MLPRFLSQGSVTIVNNNLAILCRLADAAGALRRAPARLSRTARGREATLGLFDKLLEHRANITIALGGEEKPIALHAEAIGLRIIRAEALCHAPILAARTRRVTLGRQRK
jgi:hypothetical protein